MSGLANVTRDDVLNVLDQASEAQSVEAFVELYGYQDAKRWQLRYRGRSYPSKAILGIAAGLAPRDFFGGIAQAVPALLRLGFQLRSGHRSEASPEVLKAVRSSRDSADLRASSLPLNVASYFHSGSNRPGEIRGFASLGADIGVVAHELNLEAIDELKKLGGSDVQVFVDSGAFSGELTGDAWGDVLGLYHELALYLGTQLWVVAPDVVGDQAATLELLELWGPHLQGIEEAGARVLVPVQKGELSQARFYCAAADASGLRQPIPALPCKKAATTLEEARAFFQAVRTPIVHLLGLGPRNLNAEAFVSAAGDRQVSLDSNWIRANVGRSPIRRYTAARDVASALVVGAALVAELAIVLAQGGAS